MINNIITFLTFFSLSQFVIGQVNIKAHAVSHKNAKQLTDRVYVLVKENNYTTKANKNASIYIRNLKPNTKYTLEVFAYGYEKKVVKIKTTNEDMNLTFELEGDCEYGYKSAKEDWDSNNAKLLIIGGMVRLANNDKANYFELKYGVEYYSFGCNVPNIECIEQYNKRIFKFLDKKFGKTWRNEVRNDVKFL